MKRARSAPGKPKRRAGSQTAAIEHRAPRRSAGCARERAGGAPAPSTERTARLQFRPVKAAVIYENGAPDALRYEDVTDPECPQGCVVIDVEAKRIRINPPEGLLELND